MEDEERALKQKKEELLEMVEAKLSQGRRDWEEKAAVRSATFPERVVGLFVM